MLKLVRSNEVVEFVKKMIAFKIDINETVSNDETLFDLASRNGETDSLEYLLDECSMVIPPGELQRWWLMLARRAVENVETTCEVEQFRDLLVLEFACKHNLEDAVRYLVTRLPGIFEETNVLDDMFSCCSEKKWADIFQIMFDKPYNVDHYDFRLAFENGTWESIRILCRKRRKVVASLDKNDWMELVIRNDGNISLFILDFVKSENLIENCLAPRSSCCSNDWMFSTGGHTFELVSS